MEGDEGGFSPMPMGPITVAEKYIYLLERSIELSGKKALRTLYAAVDCATTMLGDVRDEYGNPKYSLDDSGQYTDPMLRKILAEIYEDTIMPGIKGDFMPGADGQIDIQVGEGYKIRGDMNTSMMVQDQAINYAFEVAVRKVHKIIVPLSHLLGSEGLLPAHTPLSEIAAERTLKQVVDADVESQERLNDFAMQLAIDIARSKGVDVSDFLEAEESEGE